jgi:hypothetical protein
VTRHTWLLFAVAGCTPATVSLPARKPAEAVVEFGNAFERAATGSIRNRVTIAGQVRANAIVWLESVDTATSKPWPAVPPTRIVIDETKFAGAFVEIVPLGTPVEFQSKRSKPVVIRGRGAMDFAVPLPDDASVGRRVAERTGLVELTVGGTNPLHRKYLFVAANPYTTVTDPDGKCELTEIPSGPATVKVWSFNDRIVGHDRDPESGLISRYRYAEPFTMTNTVTVMPGTTIEAAFTLPR